ncbi:MAG: acyl-CoA dehydrogenase family protein, partial [Solirubrobacteraceae bacterium]
MSDSPEQAKYRANVRSWLQEHRDEAPVFAGQDEQESIAARREWQGTLAEAGLAGVTWPVELG